MHAYTDKHSSKFLLALLNSSIEIFSYRSVQAIIDYKFEITKPQI